jgi:hypothetical protein
MPVNELELATNGLGVGIGLAIMFFAADAYHWYGYMQANPAVGSVSTSPGFTAFYAVIFIAGAAIAYTFFARGLATTHSRTDR